MIQIRKNCIFVTWSLFYSYDNILQVIILNLYFIFLFWEVNNEEYLTEPIYVKSRIFLLENFNFSSPYLSVISLLPK